ncbi:bifunctional 5,10-methylenetetrahydrofolate dehydrogenase/5,10-methenyltetrahydrofolate cyclohydrolase [Glycomyces sp. TRM65418]|uniref:bifunctional 5,10-methylenetetrahydrofolate dehydrogenase/5,10-methenyltetrahydrofolate cyclohydrolase n=1 Tax=Glycomyces sp. TRM65418 TaxID=2867006 RepID=UPI001CE4E9AA|nr:bifunctional 5,10-methylenetetrahydrofolate dehydrogenase/5,10-methenyltetrahydrofolate cyclohydrolase [Glycomyces sp. TRM65418]MCC3762095.1 bifunctional 5,10-methylenetetrahydrofolate dehydrogenase/5,10-methenyltetrahydrofolate cyclohydrolase [Glycomyces sp. TRM65418]QZD56162.1 bifunctional 5,10-methylenetetrahydrofolate dehydrogenase/5,10-methenyltetrahydrofolate cyclohydrolase [Glycomyces sp. TRM65418]
MSDIDGRAVAKALRAEVAEAAARLRAEGTAPLLAVVVPTDDEGTAWYVRSIKKAAEKEGIDCRVEHLKDPGKDEIVAKLQELSADPAVHGVICQTPLPQGVQLAEVGRHIDPIKDIDGANATNLGRLGAGLRTWAPATAAAVLELLKHEDLTLEGARAVVVGRSTVVGKPAALLLLNESATVTVCHSRTKDLAAICREADVLVAAVGRAGMIGADFVKPGATVIDVGTNPTEDGGLVGDVDYDAVAPIAGRLTPVPGGVGPVTTALLLRHTVQAAELSKTHR